MAKRPKITIITAMEAAQLLGVHHTTVYEAAKRGDIPCRRIGRRYVFVRELIEQWLCGGGPGNTQAVADRDRLTAEVERLHKAVHESHLASARAATIAAELKIERDEARSEASSWRARAEVTSRDVEEAGITLAQCEAWLAEDGWTLGSHPENPHRVWEKPGHDNVRLNPNTPTWTYCLATCIAVTIHIRAKELGRVQFDLLDEMAAIEP